MLLLAVFAADCTPHPSTFGDYGDEAAATLLSTFYTGSGTWSACTSGCGAANLDWGDDSLTFTTYLRWSITRDPSLVPVLAALTATAAVDGPCRDSGCGSSDVPEWDAIADEREYEATGDPRALELSERAYASVRDSNAYALGACPSIRYQQAFGAAGNLKTLETDSNAIKAAVLLWEATGTQQYLDDARATYAAVRTYFLDPAKPLYTVYVFDDGQNCTPLAGRFFASVNGNMIWNGAALASITGDARYLADATQTAAAISMLSDPRGVFADLQAENDVVEPLVEAFYLLAVEQGVGSARDWILSNARAAIAGSGTNAGVYGRFFDGPPPVAPATLWQENGALALLIAAGALAPHERVPVDSDWSAAVAVDQDVTTLPSTLSFTGSGIALFGTLGEVCCEPGHAALAIDGQPMVDQTGLWQNKSSALRAFDDTILFAWRWPSSGAHTLQFEVPVTNAKEGGPFLHIRRYEVLP